MPRNLLEAWDDERGVVRREQRLALALTKAKAEADVTSVITGSAPASFSYFAATIPSVHQGRECDNDGPLVIARQHWASDEIEATFFRHWKHALDCPE